MRVESVNNIQTIQTAASINNEAKSNVQNIQTTNNKQKDSYDYQELSQKTKYELSIDESLWIEMIEKANKAITGATCSFEYSIHEGTKEIMVKVINKETQEVIREIPPEKILDMVAKMWEIAGIFVDERR
ncbi:flagellar protein FlaG [Lutispora thermophila]|uniref:Flagellar protein FlaG n=1 Tax=Lutispora thermophila DSM 19022 TaxID=1122184 RepID=A0A1M6AR96_9FIRM|nr:flagellar protein FlaG [Lutispora thermophila]SHI38985.1 flagellar protein FlaG [Lutispora thermophila DSM 19022]